MRWRSELVYMTLCMATLGPCVHVCKLHKLYNVNVTVCTSVNYAQSWGVRVCPRGTSNRHPRVLVHLPGKLLKCLPVEEVFTRQSTN